MLYVHKMKALYLTGALSLGLFFVGSNVQGAQEESTSFKPQKITAEVAGKYAVYAMMSSNAYHKSERVKFAIEKLGWIQVGLDGTPTEKPTRERKSGLAYDIYKKQGTEEVVISFRGTDSKRDWTTGNLAVAPFSGQYRQARKEYEKYIRSHPEAKVTVTGHSLGGGLALSISVRKGVDAIVFDSSPRIFDGLGDKHLPATRVLIYQAGEILAVVRKRWRKIFEVVSQDDIYKCHFDFKGVSRHRSDYLARGLLELGATANPELIPVLDSLPDSDEAQHGDQSPSDGDIDDRPQQEEEQDDPESFHAGLALGITFPHSGQASWSTTLRSYPHFRQKPRS